jgi:hypothetical protein
MSESNEVKIAKIVQNSYLKEIGINGSCDSERDSKGIQESQKRRGYLW